MINKLFFSAALLVAIFATPDTLALAETPSPKDTIYNQLNDHTFVYTDPVSNLETTIYLGRFGTFDRYVPCEFQDGLWSVADDGTMCLIENDEKIPPNCFTPRIKDGVATFLRPGGEVAFVSKLQPGFRLPFG